MKKSIIKKGDSYSRLTAIKFVERGHKGDQCWLFRCSCGNKKVIQVDSVKSGNTKSCGCLSVENRIKHGKAYSGVYNSWIKMKDRCLNKKHSKYKNYGGRGITICDEWLEFENFYRDMGDRPKGKTLDRIKNNLGYCKKNCKWSDIFCQNNNKRNNRLLTYKGKTLNITQWASILRINRGVIYSRLNIGWSIERTLSNN